MGDADEEFDALYGRWSQLSPAEVRDLLDGSGVRWWVAGGRAARVGAVAREHHDTDIAILRSDLPALREHLVDWHLWLTHDGTLAPLRGDTDDLPPGRDQLWIRRDAHHPWVLDVLLHPDADEWIFKRDPAVRRRWAEVLHEVDGVPYLRPEIALLHKAHLARPQDVDDLDAAVLTAGGRSWLAATLTSLGHHDWAARVSR
jgi:hypothetical protein